MRRSSDLYGGGCPRWRRSASNLAPQRAQLLQRNAHRHCPCRNAFSRELWPLPLRRQGEAGRGCPRFVLIRKTPLPSPPLPSQGRELKKSRLKPLLQRRAAVTLQTSPAAPPPPSPVGQARPASCPPPAGSDSRREQQVQ